jgi:hypothetical protein
MDRHRPSLQALPREGGYSAVHHSPMDYFPVRSSPVRYSSVRYSSVRYSTGQSRRFIASQGQVTHGLAPRL